MNAGKEEEEEEVDSCGKLPHVGAESRLWGGKIVRVVVGTYKRRRRRMGGGDLRSLLGKSVGRRREPICNLIFSLLLFLFLTDSLLRTDCWGY